MDRQTAQLVRQRVIHILQQAAQRPLTIVCAGAGYGKTTAVKQFLAQQQCASLYITVKPVHNLAEAFWLEFLTQVDTGYPDYARKLRKIGAPIEVTQFSAFVKVIQEMAAQYGCVYVVMDDFHLLHDAQTLRFVTLAARHQVPGLKIILVARTEPVPILGALQQSGLVSHVGAAQLAFQPDEVASIINARAGDDNGQLVQHILKQTDGWPLAVTLLYHTMSPDKSLDDSLEDVRPLVHSTMDRLFFRDYPLPIRRALVLLSLCETIYPELVDGIQDFNLKLLGELEALNPFIILEDRGRYRLHALYQEFLQTQAGMLGPEELCAHHNAVAAWLQENGHTFESITSYRRANNYTAAWQVILGLMGPMPSRSFVNLCSEIYEETPREVFESDGYILLHAALVLLYSKRPRRARTLLEKAAAWYTPENCTNDMLGEYHLLYGLCYFTRYDVRFVTHWQQAHALLNGRSALVDRRFRLLHVTPLEEAYRATGDGRYSAGLMVGGLKTTQALQHYRTKPQPIIPAEWLDKLQADTLRWVQNVGAMAEYQGGLGR